ncbi:hypothetical protein [Demequina litorisediminis]|uniref:Uncharacterized protein n=1 Tax=Demequina litorisediminis TaxID=1849022 RepID=A0ABQ6ICV3_9MICO|nr:hypothetical protein GCM10025876_12160 [Demequina litorisediminis]
MTARILGRVATTAIAVSALALAGCSSTSEGETSATPSDSATASAAPTASADAAGTLETVTDGVLTIATGEPAYEPWVIGDDPTTGEGFEAAVAYAVAAEARLQPRGRHLGSHHV